MTNPIFPIPFVRYGEYDVWGWVLCVMGIMYGGYYVGVCGALCLVPHPVSSRGLGCTASGLLVEAGMGEPAG